jgi:hemerythrin-like domain-containing protein
MAKSIIEPLLREHAHIRTLMGELRAHTERFDLPGMRTTSQKMIDVIRPHILKEESVLYLIGMKFLKADNKKLPELFREHDETLARLSRLTTLVFSARLVDVEEQARQLVFVILEALDHHFQDEEAVVFPALDRLIDEETKQLILARFGQLDGGDEFDAMDRMPLLSMPDTRRDANTDNIGQTQFGLGSIN